jgi:hypothetical protein
LKAKDEISPNIVNSWLNKSLGGGPLNDDHYLIKGITKIESPITGLINKSKVHGLYHITKILSKNDEVKYWDLWLLTTKKKDKKIL